MVLLPPFCQSCNPTLNPGVIRCLRMCTYLSDPGHPVHPKNSQGCSWAGLLLQGTFVVFQEGQNEVGGGAVHLKMTAGSFGVAQGAGSSCHPHLRQGESCGIALPSLPTGRDWKKAALSKVD